MNTNKDRKVLILSYRYTLLLVRKHSRYDIKSLILNIAFFVDRSQTSLYSVVDRYSSHQHIWWMCESKYIEYMPTYLPATASIEDSW